MFALVLLAASVGQADESGRAVPADLLQKAWTQGKVRVIVELGGVGALPEGQLLSRAAVTAQRGRIASDRAALRLALRGLRHRVLREFKTIPYVGLEVDHDTLRVLDALPGLATRVHEDILLRPMLAQSGPLIKAPDAWAAGSDGTGQVVAIIDTGVDKNHPFLAGKVVDEACYDSSGISTCPNGLSSDTSPGAGVPCTFAPSDCFHGTHVAGIAAGNGPSFDGIARGASLLAVRVFHLEPDAGDCAPDPAPCALASLVDIVEGLERVYELRDTYNIAAANLSLGGGGSTGFCDGFMPAMDAAIANLSSVGTATIVSSGNDGFLDAISFPACISTAISVGATGDGSGGWPTDQVTFFSNSAFFLSLLAPGALINSSVPGGGFGNAAGTSMAAPHVAGSWAIAKQANPGASVSDVLAGLQNTGRRITDVNDVITSRIAATVLQFSASAYSVAESVGQATITVTRSGAIFGPHFAPLTVDYATSSGTAIPGEDYTETSGTLTFDPGQTSKTFTVPISNDTNVDGPRTVNLTLTNPGGGALLGARDTAVLTISDNDVAGSVQFSASTFNVGEQAGIATITVTRSGGSASDVTIQYTTGDGTAQEGVDYQLAMGALTFGPGEMSRTFQVTILTNVIADGNRTVNLTLHTPGGGAVLGGQKTAVLTIVDDEIALQFNQANYSVSEGGGNVTITVTRSGPTAPPVGVTYTVVPGSATPGADYGGAYTGPLPFAANQTTRTFTISIVNDTLAEGSETVLLQLSSPTNGALLGPRQTAVLTIVDNDAGGAFRFGSASYSAGESSGTASVTIVRSGGVASNGQIRLVSVGGSAQPSIDYVAVDQIVTFLAGQTSRTVPLTLLTATNTVVDGPRTIQFALQSPAPAGLASLGTPASATVTISNDDLGGTLQWSPVSVSVLESAPTASLTVARTGGVASAVGVTWTITGGTASLDTDYGGPTSGVLTFDAGQTSQTVTIPLLNPAGAEGTRTVQVTLSAPTGGAGLGAAKVATLTLLDDEVGLRFSQLAYSVSEANPSATITVLRTGPATAPVSIDYATVPGSATPSGSPTVCTPGADYRPVSSTLMFLPGQTSKTFLVPLCGDSLVEGPETLTLVLSNPTGPALLPPPGTATLTIAENDLGGTLQWSPVSVSVLESAPTASLTVARTGGVASAVGVTWTITGGTATGGTASLDTDYSGPISGILTFDAGQTSQPVTIPLLNPDGAEGTRTVQVTLSVPTGGAGLGSAKVATLTLLDDEIGFRFSQLASSVSEANPSATIVVLRTGPAAAPASAPVSIDYTTVPDSATPSASPTVCTPGADYRPVSGTLTFLPGQTTKTILVPFCGDSLVEGSETLTLVLSNPTLPALLPPPGTATLTITENDLGGVLKFSSAAYSASETQPSVTLTVARTAGAAGGVTVDWTLTDQTALYGTDYTGPQAGTLTFAPGQLSASFPIPLLNDPLADGPRTVLAQLAPPQGGATLGTPAAAVVTIADNEPTLRLSSATYVVSEATASAILTVLRGGPTTGPVTATLVPDPGPGATGGTCGTGNADFVNASLPVALAPGQITTTVALPLCSDTFAEGAEPFTVHLADPVGASLTNPSTATITLQDNDLGGTLRWSIADTSGVEGTTLLLTVTRTGGTASDVTVQVTAHDGDSDTPGDDALASVDYETLPPTTLTFDAGVLSQTVEIPLLPRDGAQGPRAFGVVLHDVEGGAALGSPATATVWILDPS